MLSTANSSKLERQVVTDVNANVPIPAEQSRSVSPDAAILFNRSIVARPLMVPEVCSVKVKNLEYRYRWVNRDGQNGRVYMQRKAQGFTNATLQDVELLGGDVISKDGEIRAGDLILMKMQADVYDAAMKYNMQKAYAMARTRGVYMEGASADVMVDDKPRRVSVSEEPFSRQGAEPFIPKSSEIERIVDESTKAGRRDETLRATEELRAKGASKSAV